MATKIELAAGDRVTTTTATPAYYSGYAGHPVMAFVPGDVGEVVNPDHTPVRGTKRWVLLDFVKETPPFWGHEEGGPYKWRVAVERKHIRKVETVRLDKAAIDKGRVFRHAFFPPTVGEATIRLDSEGRYAVGMTTMQTVAYSSFYVALVYLGLGAEGSMAESDKWEEVTQCN